MNILKENKLPNLKNVIDTRLWTQFNAQGLLIVNMIDNRFILIFQYNMLNSESDRIYPLIHALS